MTQLITALYADHASGLAAAKELKRQGFSDKDVRVVTTATNYIAGADDAGPADDGLVAALLRDGVPRGEAACMAEGVKGGSYFISVRAQFGWAMPAIRILKSFNPEDVSSFVAKELDYSADDAAPFSETFGIPLLYRQPAAFSYFFGLPVLQAYVAPKVKLLSNAAAPFSRSLGLKTLAKNPAPFSSMFKMPTLAAVGRARR